MSWQRHSLSWLGMLSLSILALDRCQATDPCRSGLDPGQRPGPYSAVISTGPERGKAHCYICETGDRPAIVIFARTLNEPLAKLCQRLDKAVAEHQGAKLRSWATFLNVEPLSFDPKVVRWAKDH